MPRMTNEEMMTNARRHGGGWIPKCQYHYPNGARCTDNGTVSIPVARRGGRNACFCEHHANALFRAGYCDENQRRIGRLSANRTTFSMELETHGLANDGNRGTSVIGRMDLIYKGFIPTSDSTVDIEYKSPIYNGKNHIIKHCMAIHELMQNGDISIDNNCGTHIHVGIAPDEANGTHGINRESIDWMPRFVHSLYVGLSQHVGEHAEDAEKLFGRGFNRWANPITPHSSAQNHSNWINLEHDWTVEYRMCKFQSYQQMHLLIAMLERWTLIVHNEFIQKFNRMSEYSVSHKVCEESMCEDD